ncbi:MAG: hypothetical protein WA984_04765 [Phormidesmis sp.]
MSDKDLEKKQSWIVPVTVAVVGAVSTVTVAWISRPIPTVEAAAEANVQELIQPSPPPIAEDKEAILQAPPLDNSLSSNYGSETQCFSVKAQEGWQEFNSPSSFIEVESIKGFWSVDDRSYPRIGPGGHTGSASDNLQPYNHLKYDKDLPFGALLIKVDDRNEEIWLQAPRRFENNSSIIHARINDSDHHLNDNGGTLDICVK